MSTTGPSSAQAGATRSARRTMWAAMFALALTPPLAWTVADVLIERERIGDAVTSLAWQLEGSGRPDINLDHASMARVIASPPFDKDDEWRSLVDGDARTLVAQGAERARHWPALVATRELHLLGTGTARLEVRRSLWTLAVGAGIAALAGLLGAAGLWFFAFHRRMSALQQAERRLRTITKRDALTGLVNRDGLRVTLRHTLERHRRGRAAVGVLLIDLDRFHIVNNSLGHPAGDELLRSVAERIMSVACERDIVARLGADQFAVQVDGASGLAALTVMARNLLRAFESSYAVGGRDMVASLSIGVAMAGAAADNVDQLLKCAEIAMRAAKAGGGGCFRTFEPHMQVDDEKRLDMDRRLRSALKNNEFALVYQPIIDAGSGHVVAVEALMRWADPKHQGLVSPAQFIPILEQTGLIVTAGSWVLREACRQGLIWLAGGERSLVLSVNVSPRQFAEANFVGTVTTILEETGFPASRLQLEVTEGLLLDPTPDSLRKIDALVQAGVRLAVDDFGMGYSSLAYLKSLPLHTLKIDRMFVSDILERERDAAIVRAIVELGHGLGLHVTAEGVETEEQHAFLHKLGCDSMQGYLFARPMGADEMHATLRARGTCAHEHDAPPNWSATMASLLHPA